MYVNCGLCKTKEFIAEIIKSKYIIDRKILAARNFIFLLGF